MTVTQVDELIRIMPPAHGAAEEVDWDAAKAQLGNQLPVDYRDFMAAYGGGIGGRLSILLPLPSAYTATVAQLTPPRPARTRLPESELATGGNLSPSPVSG